MQFFQQSIPTYATVIDLKKIVEHIESPQNKQFKIYHPETDSYVPFEDICIEPYLVPIDYLELQIIMVKYSEYKGALAEDNNSEDETKK